MEKFKSAIVTVTQGDFDYIQEWIEYHHDTLGVDLFMIGYNGRSEDYDRLPKYDYVKYFDFSHNFNPINNCLNAKNLKEFSGWKKRKEDIQEFPLQQKILTLLVRSIKLLYPSIDYTFIIDTDEFVKFNTYQGKTFLDHLNEIPVKDTQAVGIRMKFPKQCPIYFDQTKGCLERFAGKDVLPKDWTSGGFVKTVFFMRNIEFDEIKITSPHFMEGMKYYNLYHSDVWLSHYFTKSLEEWIMKMDPSIDADYLRRFRGMVFKVYFEYNEMTDEALKAIPDLLKKYKINYSPEVEERDEDFRERYKKVNNL